MEWVVHNNSLSPGPYIHCEVGHPDIIESDIHSSNDAVKVENPVQQIMNCAHMVNIFRHNCVWIVSRAWGEDCNMDRVVKGVFEITACGSVMGKPIALGDT